MEEKPLRQVVRQSWPTTRRMPEADDAFWLVMNVVDELVKQRIIEALERDREARRRR